MPQVSIVYSPVSYKGKIKIAAMYEVLKDENSPYLYELYVWIRKNKKFKKAIISITNYGVSIEYRKSKKFLCTNLIPMNIFPDSDLLNWQELHKIVSTLENINFEGVVYRTADHYFMDQTC